MSLPNLWERIKSKTKLNESSSDISFDEDGEVIKFPWIRKFFLTLLIIMVGLLGFGVGKMSNLNQNTPIKIEYSDLDNNQDTRNKTQTISNNQNPNTQTNANIVTVSSKGTRYYYSWCKNTISERNKVSFASAILAEKAGYTLATNCSPR